MACAQVCVGATSGLLVRYSSASAILQDIVTEPEQRGRSHCHQFLRSVTDYADRAGIRLILIARPMDGTIFVDALVAPVRAPWVRCARLGARGLAAHDP